MSRPHLLLVEDDPSLGPGLRDGLREQGFRVTLAATGEEALSKSHHRPYDLLILDLNLPGCSGLEVLDALDDPELPVIVLTARTELDARLEAFRRGAVDYMAKPFYLEELVARVRARLPEQEPARRLLRLGGLVVDPEARRVLRQGVELALTPQELDLLVFLLERPERAVERTVLADEVLANEELQSPRAVDTTISRLRRKLGPEGERIETVWGIGYRLVPRA